MWLFLHCYISKTKNRNETKCILKLKITFVALTKFRKKFAISTQHHENLQKLSLSFFYVIFLEMT